jgi:hypothetical protein
MDTFNTVEYAERSETAFSSAVDSKKERFVSKRRSLTSDSMHSDKQRMAV